MNRRNFLKFLGIGTAIFSTAPKMLAENTPEVYPESSNHPITLEALQTAYGQAMFPGVPQGRYMYVKVAKNTMPFIAGDFVYYKNDKRWGVLAYKSRKFSRKDCCGYAICNIAPGNYGFIQIFDGKLAI